MITSWGKTGKENVNGIENWKQNSRVAESERNDTRAIGIGIWEFRAPAVSKWETDNSYPDITLLCPLARALDTNVDTLLEYDEVMTEEKVKAYTNEIIKIERNGDVLLAKKSYRNYYVNIRIVCL